ncbi:MAG: DUF2848 domain-containing protein [Telmatospirillum sp.]|nr:DUF2848 domain-containing protein [Telmatospirillum sp.]
MPGPTLHFECLERSGAVRYRSVDPRSLLIAGWAGRDPVAVQSHIEELAALGVPRPARVPTVYRAAASLLTRSDVIEVAGRGSSGEIEVVILSLEDGLWVGVGSDHTDRRLERSSVTWAKQLCAKPVGGRLWRLDDVETHWDQLELRSHAVIEGRRRLYQEGRLSLLLPPRSLIALAGIRGELPPGTVLFGGTLPVPGGISFASRFEMDLADPVLGRALTHVYDVIDLPEEG